MNFLAKRVVILTVSLTFILGSSVFAEDSSQAVRLKSGEMKILSFLEMVSDTLDLQIDASAIGPTSETIVVPDLGPMSNDRAKELVLSTLFSQGYTWIHDSSTDLYRILRPHEARDLEVPILTDSDRLPDSDLLVTYILNIHYTPPEYIARNLRSFMPANGRIIPDETTNSVLITDSAHNIAKLKKLVSQMDTPEAARQAKEWLASTFKNVDTNCDDAGSDKAQRPSQPILILLFSLIALVVGFLARGYVIRRIEGGL